MTPKEVKTVALLDQRKAEATAEIASMNEIERLMLGIALKGYDDKARKEDDPVLGFLLRLAAIQLGEMHLATLPGDSNDDD